MSHFGMWALFNTGTYPQPHYMTVSGVVSRLIVILQANSGWTVFSNHIGVVAVVSSTEDHTFSGIELLVLASFFRFGYYTGNTAIFFPDKLNSRSVKPEELCSKVVFEGELKRNDVSCCNQFAKTEFQQKRIRHDQQ